jgi:hypothetical protein
MAHSTGGPASGGEHASSISIPWVIGAALLCGAGLFVMMFFVLTFQLVYLVGVAPVVGGGLMLFDQRAGADHA